MTYQASSVPVIRTRRFAPSPRGTRVDLRAHGGSYFLMAHDDIVPGSEALRVEIRDALAPDRVLAVRPLTRNIDYEIDSHTGAVRLYAPLAAFDTRTALNNAGVNGGNPVWLVAEYAYSPERGDYGTAGARWLHWTPDGFGFGLVVQKNRAAAGVQTQPPGFVVGYGPRTCAAVDKEQPSGLEGVHGPIHPHLVFSVPRTHMVVDALRIGNIINCFIQENLNLPI